MNHSATVVVAAPDTTESSLMQPRNRYGMHSTWSKEDDEVHLFMYAVAIIIRMPCLQMLRLAVQEIGQLKPGSWQAVASRMKGQGQGLRIQHSNERKWWEAFCAT